MFNLLHMSWSAFRWVCVICPVSGFNYFPGTVFRFSGFCITLCFSVTLLLSVSAPAHPSILVLELGLGGSNLNRGTQNSPFPATFSSFSGRTLCFRAILMWIIIKILKCCKKEKWMKKCESGTFPPETLHPHIAFLPLFPWCMIFFQL